MALITTESMEKAFRIMMVRAFFEDVKILIHLTKVRQSPILPTNGAQELLSGVLQNIIFLPFVTVEGYVELPTKSGEPIQVNPYYNSHGYMVRAGKDESYTSAHLLARMIVETPDLFQKVRQFLIDSPMVSLELPQY